MHVREDMTYRSLPGTKKKGLEIKVKTTCKEQIEVVRIAGNSRTQGEKRPGFQSRKTEQ